MSMQRPEKFGVFLSFSAILSHHLDQAGWPVSSQDYSLSTEVTDTHSPIHLGCWGFDLRSSLL